MNKGGVEVDEFSDKVALVVGGTSGMGKATALAFGKVGARVAVSGRRLKEGKETVSEIQQAGGEAIFVQADVMDSAQVEEMMASVIGAYGRIDYACNSVGIETAGAEVENWDLYINTVLRGKWYCMKYQVQAMLKCGGGAIVNIGSSMGLPGGINDSPPIAVAGGHGLVGLTKSMALHYADKGIRINVVCPGAIRTPLLGRYLEQYKDTYPNIDIDEMMKQYHPMKRIGEPEEIAEAVLFLCSRSSSFITGCALPVDGGATAR